MKKLSYVFYFVLATFFVSCHAGIKEPKKPTKKPFIITYKYPDGQRCNNGWCSYEYTDANENIVPFCEHELKYSIGDTIK